MIRAAKILSLAISLLSSGCQGPMLHHPSRSETTAAVGYSSGRISVESLQARFVLNLHDVFVMELALGESGRFDLTYRYNTTRTCFDAHMRDTPTHSGWLSGTYSHSSDLLTLIPEKGEPPEPGLPLGYSTVRWGERLYLVDDGSLESFRDDAGTGRLRQMPQLFLLRDIDSHKQGFGEPCMLRIEGRKDPL